MPLGEGLGKFELTVHLVWGRVPQTGIAAAVRVLEWGSTSASATVDYLASTRPFPLAPPRRTSSGTTGSRLAPCR
jgi:hypothetical protein